MLLEAHSTKERRHERDAEAHSTEERRRERDTEAHRLAQMNPTRRQQEQERDSAARHQI